MPYENGPFMCMEIPNEDTGQIERKYFSIPELFNRIWDDYIRLMIPDGYCREMLKELGLSGTEVFHMMERLQGGKAEFLGRDYTERSYT